MSDVNIHKDVEEIMGDADASPDSKRSIGSWGSEQKAVLRDLLECAWNRGYKKGWAESQHLTGG